MIFLYRLVLFQKAGLVVKQGDETTNYLNLFTHISYFKLNNTYIQMTQFKQQLYTSQTFHSFCI